MIFYGKKRKLYDTNLIKKFLQSEPPGPTNKIAYK